MAATASIRGENALIHSLHENFEQTAARLGGYQDRDFRIAGHHVRLRFAGPAWCDILTRALAHLTAHAPEGAEPDLTVHIWDGSTGRPGGMIGLLMRAMVTAWPTLLNSRGQILDLHSGPLVAVFTPGPDLLSVTDTRTNAAYYWKSDAREVPYYEAGSPLRSLLHAWLVTRGCQFLHGAAVGRVTGGVLLAGKGGSGKSTTAVACLRSNLLYAGDDYCMVSGGEVHSLYNTAKLVGEADLERFPELAPKVFNPGRPAGDKATVFLNEHFPDKLTPGFPLRAILLPRVSGGPTTRLEPCSPRDALMALAPTTMAQLPAASDLDMRQMSQISRSVPAYHLHLGSQIDAIPGEIEAYLDRC